jgi:hypothetical protein
MFRFEVSWRFDSQGQTVNTLGRDASTLVTLMATADADGGTVTDAPAGVVSC